MNLVVQYVHDYAALPNSQLLLVSIQRPTCAHDPSQVDPTKNTCVILCRVHVYVIFGCFAIAHKLLLVIVRILPFLIGYAVRGEYGYLSMDVLRIIIDTLHMILLSVNVCTIRGGRKPFFDTTR